MKSMQQLTDAQIYSIRMLTLELSCWRAQGLPADATISASRGSDVAGLLKQIYALKDDVASLTRSLEESVQYSLVKRLEALKPALLRDLCLLRHDATVANAAAEP